MSFAKNIVLISLLSAVSLPVLAYTANCSKPANDVEVTQCAQDNKNNAEKALNDEYANAKERIKQGLNNAQPETNEYLDLLLKAQRGWLTSREYQCEMEAYGLDKQKNPYTDITNECIARMDRERIQTLKQIPGDTL